MRASNSWPIGDALRQCHTYTYTDAQHDANCDTNGYAHSDIDANGNSDGYGDPYRHSYSYAKTDSYTAESPDAKGPAYAASPTLISK